MVMQQVLSFSPSVFRYVFFLWSSDLLSLRAYLNRYGQLMYVGKTMRIVRANNQPYRDFLQGF